MSFLCSAFWIDGRVSDCVIINYLSKVVPLAICSASIAIYSLKRLYPFIPKAIFRYRKVPKIQISNPGTTSLAIISPRISQLEIGAILADIHIGFLLLVGIGDTADHLAAFISAVSSTYLLFLALVRKILWDTCVSYELQYHSIMIYAIQVTCLAIVNHTMIIQTTPIFVLTANLLRFVLFAVLCLCHWTAPRLPISRQFKGDDIATSDISKQETASVISCLTFSWLNGLVWKSFRATLEVYDLYQLSYHQKCGIIIPHFQTTTPATSLLLRRLFRIVQNDMLQQGGWAALNSVFILLPPVLIRAILQHLEYPDTILKSTAWLCAGGILVAGAVSSIAGSQCGWMGNRMTAKLRAILINEIYEKSLRKKMTPHSAPEGELHTETQNHATDGNILNLMSVDVEHVSEMSGSLYLIWVIFPVQTTLGTWLLYKILGTSGVLGVLCMVCLLPLNFIISQQVMKVQAKLLKASDSRIQTGNEILNNIHTVKYSAWETHFQNRVMQKRKLELDELRFRYIWWSINATTFHSLPFIVTIITCFFYTLVWDNPLKTSVAFPALAIFGIIRIPLDRMAASITFLLQAHVSLGRIDKFLQEREPWKTNQVSKSEQLDYFGFDDATLSWPTRVSLSAEQANSPDRRRGTDIPLDDVLFSGIGPFRLKNLNIQFKPESLNIVCGPSGSGKSSLLLALLGEMDLINGQIRLPQISNESVGNSTIGFSDAVAYCPQEPWIMNESIRSNIIFNMPFESERYAAVLDAVALFPDIRSLDQGDQTHCGENGARLSGGQKQRVALGRALYSRCRYALLDDCLSALDSHTASHIFFRAVKGPLMKGRTCILATHNMQLTIPHSYYVVMLDSGHVKGQGSPEELVRSGILNANMLENKAESPISISSIANIGTPTLDYAAKLSLDTDSLDEISLAESDKKETYKEQKAEGAISSYVIWSYLTAMGSRLFLVIVLGFFALQQIASLGTTLWIKEWALQSDLVQDLGEDIAGNLHVQDSEGPNEIAKIDPWFYITVYAGLCGLYALITIVRDLITFHGSLKASFALFEQLLNSVLHAKLHFFDKVPLGQITNRFSKDVEATDQVIPGFAISALQLVATITMVVVFISVVLPAFLIVALFICVAYYFVLAVYINAARDLKRIEAIQRSPLFQQFGETLSGYISIRAYHQTSIFTAQNRTLIDKLNQTYLLQCAGKEWLTFRVTLLGSLISFSTAAFVLWSPRSIDFGSAGLVLTYSTTFTENIMWFVQVYAFIQQNLNSVDRILEYSKVEQENYLPRSTATYDMPSDWPSQGGIRFINYTTRYASDLNPALSQVSFEAKPGQRIGIVGRTGAGKSTLTLALLRCLEAESGRIEIDGVDVSTLPLEKLRQAVAIVPQNPEIFDGTIRENVDPLQRYTDDEVISALNQVRLFEQINRMSTGPTVSFLDRAADALSLGQRQLLCIARALLRHSRILVLDEATASIDHATDAAIQASLEESVRNETTVLTIAHRLRTIADYDHIVVLDSGRIVEQGSVKTLLAGDYESSVFRRMCEESGDLEAVLID